MAISIDWGTSVITVPKADMTLVQTDPHEIRDLDINTFRLALKSLEDDPAGMGFPKTHTHNTEVTLGGLTFARVIEILSPYTVTFEDGQYQVNLVGANSNIADRRNLNQVSLVPNNSAGLIVYTSGSGVTAQDKLDIINGTLDALLADHSTSGSVSEAINMVKKAMFNKAVRAADNSTSTIYDDDGVTPLIVFNHPTIRERNPE